jgi:hypothetical protein
MDDVLNDTVIINLFDNYEYVYNKDQGIWANYKNGFLTIATNNHLGVVKGTEPPADPSDDSKNTFIQILSDGSMKTIGEAGKIDTVNNRDPDNDKNVDTHVTMTQAEYDAITDKNTLNGLQITITDVEYPDGGLMMVPDYANRETINRTPTAGSSWKVDTTGFVFLQYQRNADAADGATPFFINEQTTGNVRLPYEGWSDIVPVSKDDIIRAGNAHYTASYCYFIPPKLVQKLPPIIVEGNGSYSYDEIESNDTWLDGRKIFKKSFDSPSNIAGSWVILKPIQSEAILTRCEVVGLGGGTTNGGAAASARFNGSNIEVYTHSTINTPGVVTIFYVKAV